MRSLLLGCGFALSAAYAVVACGDSANSSSNNSAGSGGVGGTGTNGGTANEGGTASGNSGAGSSAGGSSDAGGSNADGGAGGSAGAAGVPCHISWTGAETGEADCGHNGVCHQNFLSINASTPATSAPITAVQLIFVADPELTVGTLNAVGMEIVDTAIATSDSSVSYGPEFDPMTHLLTGGSSLTLTLTSIQFSTDPNDACSGVAHGSLDAVLPQLNGSAGAKKLAVHADF